MFTAQRFRSCGRDTIFSWVPTHSMLMIFITSDSSGFSSAWPVKATIWLPDWHRPCSLAALIVRSIMLSDPWYSGILRPTTPRVMLSCFRTAWFELHARMGTGGLYLAMRRAMCPVSVITIIRSMLKSRTVCTAAEAIASFVGRGG